MTLANGKNVIIFFLCTLSALNGIAQTDTTLPKTPVKNVPKPYKEVITAKAITDEGLFKVHKIDLKYFFELSDSLLNRDILIVNRISKASSSSAIGRASSMLGFAGDAIGENVVQFVKGPNNKLFMKSISYLEMSKDSTQNGLYRSVLNSNLQPIVAAFDIKAFSKDSLGVVIDITDYISGDNDILFFETAIKKRLALGAIQADKSYVDNIRSFPSNIEIITVKTYAPGAAANILDALNQVGASPKTFELNTSIVLLPRYPMQPRYEDKRIGYFSTGYKDFDANPQGVERTNMITRWRLEPRTEDIEKYKNGELVEPKKPIVFYIDPATPKKWVPYLIQGVNDWQKSFEKAGFKNAIYALNAPVNDPEWNLNDATHNAIVYKPSDISNASGPHVHDPRSGEILETHVNWYHNIMKLIHDWYMIQAGAVDPKARKMQFSDSLMGQLIRFVSSHEVGHTLGLMHNFVSSSTVPVENLRNKKWVEENGHTPSIMDYARFNYVAQPEDNISEKGIFPRIGVYDEWAIEWGYRWFPDVKSSEEKAYLNKWVIEKNKDNRLWFNGGGSPSAQSEDLGDNAMKAGAYGIKNLQRILPQLKEWTSESNEGYASLKQLQKGVIDQYKRYLGHVANIIGGYTFTAKTIEQTGPVVRFESREKQREAIRFLHEQLFQTPTWIVNKEIFSLVGGQGAYEPLTIQKDILATITSESNFSSFLWFESTQPGQPYTADELFTDIESGIWSELSAKAPITLYRRNLQRLYVERLIALNESKAASIRSTDGLSIVQAHMRSLIVNIDKASLSSKDKLTKYHLADVKNRLRKALGPTNSSGKPEAVENKTESGFNDKINFEY